MTEYTTGVGIMSGTSLDGIDLAYCRFNNDDPAQYEILHANTFPYRSEMRKQLAQSTTLSAIDYCKLDVALGELFAEKTILFLANMDKPDFIASHGHTVFHQPQNGITSQIGSGAVIAARTGITTVCDFRSLDVAHHGQGAPLVPIGDELLFSQYDACLNLGGFANISFRLNEERIAFDITACNMLLNQLANQLGCDYDENGNMAQSGILISSMLTQLNSIPHFRLFHPKSLGKEWFDCEMLPIIHTYLEKHPVQDCLRTATEHIALQIAKSIPSNVCNIFVTGGGAYNLFLLQRLQELWRGEIIVPDKQTVNFKEALLFAFLGFLRLKHHQNCLKSVTGADKSCCGGCIWEG